MMLVRLARKDGCSIRDVQDRYSVDEFALWIAEWERSPWGQDRDDISRAVIGAALLQVKGCKVESKDLMPDYDHQPLDPAIAKELAALQIDAAVAQHNSKYERTDAKSR